MRPAWVDWGSSYHGARRAGHKPRHVRRVVQGGLASALAVVGLVAFATPAFAHHDIISASASCSPPLGSGFTVTWTIQNDFNLTQTGSVTSITYGLSTLNHTTYSIAASPGEPYSFTTLTQTLPATASGTITIDVSNEWSDGLKSTLSSSYSLSLDCAAPVQTIAGHIYLCNDGNPTTTEESGGTLAASGPTTVAATANPLAPTSVLAGGFTMTATSPPGYKLVTCGGSSTPDGSGSSATEPVTVPSGGAGVGIFYVTPVTQTIAGHIYLCNAAGTGTTTEVSGGTLAASGPTTVAATANPLAPTSVLAGGFTMTATSPPGYKLVTCGGLSTPDGSGSSATEPVTVPSGGAGVGIFYVVAPATQVAVVTNSATTTPSTPSTPTTTSSQTTPATVSTLAATGAGLSLEWLIGAAALLLGSTMVVTARRRRPKDID